MRESVGSLPLFDEFEKFFGFVGRVFGEEGMEGVGSCEYYSENGQRQDE